MIEIVPTEIDCTGCEYNIQSKWIQEHWKTIAETLILIRREFIDDSIKHFSASFLHIRICITREQLADLWTEVDTSNESLEYKDVIRRTAIYAPMSVQQLIQSEKVKKKVQQFETV